MSEKKNTATRQLAERIARDLFTNGRGARAQRLVLMVDGRDLGGWNERAATDRIELAIVTETLRTSTEVTS